MRTGISRKKLEKKIIYFVIFLKYIKWIKLFKGVFDPCNESELHNLFAGEEVEVRKAGHEEKGRGQQGVESTLTNSTKHS